MQPSDCTLEEAAGGAQFEDDDGNVYYGAEATRRANAYFGEIAAKNRAYVQQLTPDQRKQLERVIRRRATQPVQENIANRDVAPVDITGERSRTTAAGRPGARRAQRSSAKSGDSGDDGPGGPPRGRRLSSRAEIDAWVAERGRVLSALVEREGLGRRQLGFDEEVAA